MITYEEALEIARRRKGKIDKCVECENAYIFSHTEDSGYDGGYGHVPVVVMKEDGRIVFGMPAILNGSVGDEIREFDV